MRKIILASQSPQRKLLMKTLGIPFEVVPADIDEKSVILKDQKLRAKLIAKAKAESVLRSLKKENKFGKDFFDGVVIAADTFTLFNNKAYEKPTTKIEAIKMLEEQSGQTGFCYSGFSYIDEKNNININKIAVTKISLRKLSSFEIQKYVDENPVLTWSAAFSPAYPEGISFISNIEGSLSSFTHGLPIELLVPLLENSGVFNAT